MPRSNYFTGKINWSGTLGVYKKKGTLPIFILFEYLRFFASCGICTKVVF